MHQSCGVGTSVCANIKEAREELKSLRWHMIRLARENGCGWRSGDASVRRLRCRSYAGERYKTLCRICNWWRGPTNFGLHVLWHRGSRSADPDDESCRYFIPHLLALSTIRRSGWDGHGAALLPLQVLTSSADESADYFPSWANTKITSSCW